MRSKENNPYCNQVNSFFAEVQDNYMNRYREMCQPHTNKARQQKKELFALERKLADVEYESSQKELTLKKLQDD